jgi:hypothetical protein
VCNQPSQLWVGYKVVPRLPHIGKQRLDLLVHDAVGDLLDRLTYLLSLNRRFICHVKRKTCNIVPAPDGERHAVSDEI